MRILAIESSAKAASVALVEDGRLIAQNMQHAGLTQSKVLLPMIHSLLHCLDMQVGDVLKLDSYVNSDLEIRIGNLLKFYAKPGTLRGKYALQISSLIKREE